MEALRRGTSTYVPGAVEPMLPAVLSDGACSLAPGVERLAVSAEIVLGEDGMPIRFDATVQPDVLERLRFRSRRGERALKYVEDGKLKRQAAHLLVAGRAGQVQLSPDVRAEVPQPGLGGPAE